MEKKFETKRQHYVPRFLLRNFSSDERTVALVVLESGKVVPNASIKGQCYEDYFYGADGTMEKAFGSEEALIGSYLSDLSPGHLNSLGPDIHDRLRRFVHVQRMRTRGSANALNNHADAVFKAAFAPVIESDSKFPPNALDSVRLGLSDPQGEALWAALCSAPLVRDLAVKFIRTTRAPWFVVSDHPVVTYNQFAQTHPKFRHFPFTTGLPDKGLQMFLPLSPDVVLAVFDPGTYASSEHELVCHASKRDVHLLNTMQALNAVDCMYFGEHRPSGGSLRKLLQSRSQHGPAGGATAATGDMMRNASGAMSQIVVTMQTEIRLGSALSCFRTIDTGAYLDYEGIVLPPRSPHLVEFTKRYRERQDAKVDSERARMGLPPLYGRPR